MLTDETEESRPTVRMASSFTDIEIAEKAVSALLEKHKLTVESFAASPNPKEANLVLVGTWPSPLGKVMMPGQTASKLSSNYLIVLKKAPDLSDGYFVLTGYPVP